MSKEMNLDLAIAMYCSAEHTLEMIYQSTGVTRDKLYAYLRATGREEEIAVHRTRKASKHIIRSPRALKALELVESGMSEREAAEQVGVSRQYVNSFRRRIQGAAMNQRRPPGQKVKQVDPQKLNEVVEAFRSKEITMQQAADRVGVTKPTMRRWMIELQVIDEQWRDQRRLKFSPEQAQQAIQMYQEGAMVLDILRATGFSRPQLYQELQKSGIKPNRRRQPFEIFTQNRA